MFKSNLFRSAHRTFSAKILLLIMGMQLVIPLLHARKSKNQDVDQGSKVTIYSRIGDQFLPSIAKQAQTEARKAEQLKHQNAVLLKKKKISDVKVLELGSAEKFNLLFSILSEAAPEQPAGPRDVINASTCSDMELLCGESQENLHHHILSCIDHTVTTAGNIELQKMLFSPLCDVKQLKKRQSIVQKLTKDKELFEQVEQLLQELKKSENELIWFWKPQDEATTLFFDEAYFKSFFLKWLNSSSFALEAEHIWTTTISPILRATWPFLITYCYSLGLQHHWNTLESGEQEFLTRVFGDPNWINSYKEFLLGIKKMTLDIILDNIYVEKITIASEKITEHLPIEPQVRMLVGGVCSIFSGIWGWIFSNGYSAAKKQNQLTQLIQSKMINIATYTNTIKTLANVVEQDQKFARLLPSLENLKTLGNPTLQVQKLVGMLASSTFQGKASFFSNHGKSLAAFKMMYEAKNGLLNGIAAAGELDAYMSIVKLYKKYKNHPNVRYCFVDFETLNKPHLKIDGFWHPFLNPDKAVPNSIELGRTQGQNMVVTGPNAGGKSTALKGMAIAVLLAQSLGIAPAQVMSMTPFAKISTYLNIADTEGKESLFQAEMRRVTETINMMESLKANEFSFVIMDEIFTGTNPIEAEEAAYRVAGILKKFDQSICVLATHFKKLTQLEQETQGFYKNYKVWVEEKANGAFHCPYKIVPGIADQAIALKLLQNEGFTSQTLQQAFGNLIIDINNGNNTAVTAV